MILSVCKRKVYEHSVQNGLSISPSKMAELTAKGVPVSVNNLGVTYETGVDSLSYDVPPQYHRGVDLADLWNMEISSRNKIKKAYNNLKQQGNE